MIEKQYLPSLVHDPRLERKPRSGWPVQVKDYKYSNNFSEYRIDTDLAFWDDPETSFDHIKDLETFKRSQKYLSV
jgi:hypothetical protein